jgi:hypothetical protein
VAAEAEPGLASVALPLNGAGAAMAAPETKAAVAAVAIKSRKLCIFVILPVEKSTTGR